MSIYVGTPSGVAILLSDLDINGSLPGRIVAALGSGDQYFLAESSAAVDHDNVEAVKDNGSLRWLKGIVAATADSPADADSFAIDLAAAANPVVLVGKTAPIDLLTTGTYPLDLPLISGKSALALVSRIVVTARTGSATGTAVYSCGNNGSVDNLFAATNLAASIVNTSPVSAFPFSATGASVGGLPAMDTTELSIKVATPLGGASVCTAVFYVAVWYV